MSEESKGSAVASLTDKCNADAAVEWSRDIEKVETTTKKKNYTNDSVCLMGQRLGTELSNWCRKKINEKNQSITVWHQYLYDASKRTFKTTSAHNERKHPVDFDW